MGLPSLSQTTSTVQNNRVTTTVNEKGDTLVTMSYEDARVLLRDVLYYEYTDSLLTVFKERDSLNTSVITMQKEVLVILGQQKLNLEQMITNLETVIENKDVEIGLKDDIIKQQKKEIRKQKILKIVGFSAAIVLPILTLLVLI
jgi:hypothetical protein